MGAGAASVVQQVTWEEALRAGRVLFGTGASQLFDGGGWRDELKRAYKRRVLETHPDRALALGRSEVELAREFQAVADAYRLLQEAPDTSRWLRARAPHAAPRPAQRPAPDARRAREEPHANPNPHAHPHRGARRPAETARQREERAAQERQRAARVRADEAARRVAEQLRREELERQERVRAEAERARSAAGAAGEAARRRAAADAERARRPEPRARRAHGAAAGFDWRYVAKARPLPRRRMRLAEYLYYTGRISWAELSDAIAWQRRQRPAVGRIAVDYGFLTAREVMEVIDRRRRDGADEVPFGEYALRLGFITPFERLAMVGRQTRLQRPIGQYFVERGLVAEREFEELRRQIIRHNLRHWV